MEFEVRVVGGIESCYVALPLSLIQTLQSGYLPPVLVIELRFGDNLWHVAWSGSGSVSSSSPSSIEYAECIGMSDRTIVKVRIVSNLLKATLVTVKPLTEDDWEILELNSELAEEDILKQEILVDRSVHAAIGRFLSTDLSFHKHEKPTLVRDDFLLAMDDFLPIAMCDITKPSKDGGHSGWENVGGLDDIQSSIKEIIELPSKFPNIFIQSPLRMRSNVLLYGPPGRGKTHCRSCCCCLFTTIHLSERA